MTIWLACSNGKAKSCVDSKTGSAGRLIKAPNGFQSKAKDTLRTFPIKSNRSTKRLKRRSCKTHAGPLATGCGHSRRPSTEGRRPTAHPADKIGSLDKRVEEASMQDARWSARNRLWQLPAPPR